MTAKKLTSEDVNVDVQIAVGILQNQITDVQKVQSRMETKLDNLSVVHPAELEQFKLYVQRELDKKIDKEEFTPVKKLAYGLVALVLTGVIGIIFAIAQNKLGG